MAVGRNWALDGIRRWSQTGRIGDKKRDTEATNPPLTLIDARFGFGIPTAETARWAISVFNGIVRGHLPTAETRKTVNESGGINIDAALSLLNPTPPIQGGDTVAEGIGGCFISALLSYPRFIMPGGAIEIGGVDYLDLWQDNKPLPHNRYRRASKTPQQRNADQSGEEEAPPITDGRRLILRRLADIRAHQSLDQPPKISLTATPRSTRSDSRVVPSATPESCELPPPKTARTSSQSADTTNITTAIVRNTKERTTQAIVAQSIRSHKKFIGEDYSAHGR